MTSILIIDDDTDILRRLALQFRGAGYEVKVATDGEIGLRLFAEHRPQAVLTDIVMPRREGIETILEIRKVDPTVKIVAMSGGGRIGAHEFLGLAGALGADAGIAKPFRFAEILRIVEDLLEPSRGPAPAAAELIAQPV